MPSKIEFLQCPGSVIAGQAFDVDVVVESSEQVTMELELRRVAPEEGPWHTRVVIGSANRGGARFCGVSLTMPGAARLYCVSTSHSAIPDGISVWVDTPTGSIPSGPYEDQP